jgi:hypothetical protein
MQTSTASTVGPGQEEDIGIVVVHAEGSTTQEEADAQRLCTAAEDVKAVRNVGC